MTPEICDSGGELAVVQVVASMGRAYGGPPAVARGLTDALRLRGHSVKLHTTDWLAASGTLVDVSAEDETVHRAYLEPWCLSWTMIPRLVGEIRRSDVVHVHGHYRLPMLAAAVLALAFGKALVMRPHGTFGVILRSSDRLQRQRRWADRLVEFPLMRRAGAVHCTSQDEADRILDLVPEARVFVIPNGVDLPDLSSLLDEDSELFTVLYLGRVVETKRVELIVEAFCKFAQGADANPRLKISGPEESGSTYGATLRDLVEQLGCAHLVEFTGQLDARRRDSELASAGVLVLASAGENFGVVVAEAMASRTPVLVTENLDIAQESNGQGLD